MVGRLLSHKAVLAIAILSAILSGCSRRSNDGPVVISAIDDSSGKTGSIRDPDGTSARLLTSATAQGLVRFDAAGQIEPALAERWIVTDGGRSYIFRLADNHWADGTPITSAQVVRILSRAIRRGSRNPLEPYLSAIDEIVEMTPQVIEIRLGRPRPDLLKLFAQPELAIARPRPAVGGGPYRPALAFAGTLLRPIDDPNRDDEDRAETSPGAAEILLIGERAARAVARFAARRSDLVAGGTYREWPLLAVADLPRGAVRLDPAAGLFGLAIVSRDGILAEPLGRAAVAVAIDRAAITGAFTPGWATTDRVLPEQLDSAAAPAQPPWQSATIDQARAVVSQWQTAHPGPITLRVAMPAGPGATIAWGQIGARLARIGVTAQRVGPNAPAELRMIDQVAPYDSARWYLANACALCSPEASAAIEAARLAPSLPERAQRTAEADRLLTDDVAFIPIARPLRWSLVSNRLRQWQGNPRAWHPLNHLRNED